MEFYIFKKRLRSEHLRLMAECRQMADSVQHLSESHGHVTGDIESVEMANSLDEVIEELNYYESYLDDNDILPNEISDSYLRLHRVLSEQVSGADHAKEKFAKQFGTSTNTQQNKEFDKKKNTDFVLKFIIIVTFAICMWVFFYSKL